MKRRTVSFLLASLLLLFSIAPVLAQSPAVSDQAAVINVGLADEITQYAQLAEDSLGIGLRVMTKHFLGGADVQDYADKALGEMPDNENLVLLVMVIGEESYAAALGSRAKELLGQEKTENLLLNSFRQPFIVQRAYDRALASFILALGEHLQSAAGVRLPQNSLLLDYAGQAVSLPRATNAPSSPVSWLEGILADAENSIKNADRYTQESKQAEEGQGKGMSLFQIALIGFILYKIFGKKKTGRKGCGPLSWIFGTWGVSKFFGWRK